MADQKISALTELAVPPDATDELVVVDKSDTTMAASGTDKRIQFSNLFDWAEAGDLSVIEPDDAAAAGTSVEVARADHQHAIAAAPAGTIEPNDTTAEGAATSFARSNHRHGIATATASVITGTAAEGSATSFARSDHDHALPIWGMYPTYVLLAAPVSTATGVANTYYTLPIRVMSPTTITGVEIKNGGTMNGNLRCALYDVFGTKLADRTSDLAQAGTANTRRRVPFTSTYAAPAGFYSALIWFSSATATAFMAPVLGTVGSTGTNATTTPTTPAAASDLTATLVPMLQVY